MCLLISEGSKGEVMNFKTLLAFGIGIGAYLLIMGAYALIKYFRNKKKLQKEIAVKQDEQIEEKNE